MAVLTKDEYFDRVNAAMGDRTDDDSISFVEDMNDTYNDLEARADSENWRQKYEENDKMWREKYKHRFFTDTSTLGPNKTDEGDEEEEIETTIEDIFEEEKT